VDTESAPGLLLNRPIRSKERLFGLLIKICTIWTRSSLIRSAEQSYPQKNEKAVDNFITEKATPRKSTGTHFFNLIKIYT